MSLSEFPQVVNGELPEFSTSSEIGHNGGPPLNDSAFPSREGFVAIARALRDHWLVGFGQSVDPADDQRGAFSRAEAWIDLIMECRYREGTVNNNGRKMSLKKGQLLGAVSWLANRWNWSPKTVRGFLDKLEKEGMITQTAPSTDENAAGSESGTYKGKYAKVLSVSKYELFQLAYRDAGQLPGQVQGKLRAGTGQVEGNIYKEETKEQGNKGTKEQSSKPEAVIQETLAGQDLASQMAEDVASWMHGGDDKLARTWLRNASTSYGSGNLRDAWMKLKTDLAEGRMVANKLATLSAIAKRIKETAPVPQMAEPQSTKKFDYAPSAKDKRTSEHTEFMNQIKNIKV